MGGISRQPRALGACLLFATLLAPAAVDGRAYPFDDTGYLGTASLMPDWRETLSRQRAQSIVLAGCLETADCPATYRGLTHLLSKAAALNEERQIRLVNHYVNRKRYKLDRARKLTTDLSPEPVKYRSRWSTVQEFLARGGDCEDFATTKYFLLRGLGIPAERLRVVIAYDRKAHSHHALLAVRHPDGDVWLLDTDSVIRNGHRHDYRFVYSVNEASIWDHEAPSDVAEIANREKETST